MERKIAMNRKRRWTIGLAVIAAFLGLSPATMAPAAQNTPQPGGRFQPSQTINADTIVDFPVDI
ncbi:MAG: hypothetical protein D6782_06805 [Alphaproteobacteria bacterium]|nr:MAG: hypothetical protein D6782_06805 [Alphaproteobacteria bacterium]